MGHAACLLYVQFDLLALTSFWVNKVRVTAGAGSSESIESFFSCIAKIVSGQQVKRDPRRLSTVVLIRLDQFAGKLVMYLSLDSCAADI